MTNKEIEAMKAGRDLDAIIAQELMGWTGCDATEKYPEGKYGDTGDELSDAGRGIGHEPKAAHGYRYPFPKYSTDIAAAWKVVDKFGAWDLRRRYNGEISYYVRLFDGDKWLPEADGELSGDTTAPVAICHAALRAVTNVQAQEPKKE